MKKVRGFAMVIGKKPFSIVFNMVMSKETICI